jgi:hypothetical protein
VRRGVHVLEEGLVTKQRKIATVVVALGVFLFFVGFAMHQSVETEKASWRSDIRSSSELMRPITAAAAAGAVDGLETDEKRATETSGVGMLMFLVGGVWFLVGGKTIPLAPPPPAPGPHRAMTGREVKGSAGYEVKL